MDLSLLDEQILLEMADDDSFIVTKPEAMDDEVAQILKKWNSNNNPVPARTTPRQSETFDSRTFTRTKRRVFLDNEQQPTSLLGSAIEADNLSSGISSLNPQEGPPSHASPACGWSNDLGLSDVSPPNSICTSLDFQNCDNMLNSLITSSDFSNVSFLLNRNEANDTIKQQDATVSVPKNRASRNLMDFTFDVVNSNAAPSNATFVADVESPMKEFGVENVDITFNDSTEDLSKNLTYDAHTNGINITWDKIQSEANKTIVQSTPVQSSTSDIVVKSFDHEMSPISSRNEENISLRNVNTRKLDATIDDYRNSMEDQCEFLLNEETIKLSSRVYGGSTFEVLDLKDALIHSDTANEKEFDAMLDSFNVKKSYEGEKLLQSVDNIKQRHSLINFEKQREEKQKKEIDSDNKAQYDTMNKSNERLLRRSRLYDDVNLQLQKQQTESPVDETLTNNKNVEKNSETEDKNNRDRFKTIKLNKKLQSGMVIVDVEPKECENDSISPGTNKENRNQINQHKQDEIEYKKPAPVAASRLSKFGFSRPTYRSRNELNLPLKIGSTDSLDNNETGSSSMKSPMGVKSKSIHNLMFNGNSGSQNGIRMGSYSNLRLDSRSQSNLKTPRASSLVRPSVDKTFKAPPTYNNSNCIQMRAPSSRKTSLIRPSSGYSSMAFTSKRNDSDNESLSSSSASSRNSVHVDLQLNHAEPNDAPRKQLTGTVPKLSGLRPPNIRTSGLPRPTIVRR